MTEKEAKIPQGYELTPDGGLRLVVPKACGNGHEPALPSWGSCPKCRTMTMRFSCKDPYCDGILTSKEHQQVCGQKPGCAAAPEAG